MKTLIRLLLPASLLLLACNAVGLLAPAAPPATTVAPLPTEVPPPTEAPAEVEPTPTTAAAQATEAPPEPTAEPPIATPTQILQAQQLPNGSDYELAPIADGFRRPLYVTHAGDGSGRLFVVEQRGVIWIVRDGQALSPPFLDISARVTREANEQGMLGLAFHPNYVQNGYFFVHYSDLNGDTVISRFGVSGDPNLADAGSEETVLTQWQPYGNHNGGQIAFGADGYLYIGLGDGGSAGDPQGNGQNLTSWLGSILRVDVDHGRPYKWPPDNPFLQNENADSEIWSYGLRNPWRFSFDRLTGDLYIGDVGQNDWEEIDFQPANSAGGENYGWNPMEGNHCFQGSCDPSAYVAPIVEYHLSQGNCSVTGGYVYRGQYDNGLNGVYLYGDYCSGSIWALLQTSPGQWDNTLLMRSGLNISSFGEDEAGEIYVVDHGGGVYWLKHVAVP